MVRRRGLWPPVPPPLPPLWQFCAKVAPAAARALVVGLRPPATAGAATVAAPPLTPLPPPPPGAACRACSVGLAAPAIEVRYRDLSVETTALVGSKQIPTVARTVSSSFKARRREQLQGRGRAAGRLLVLAPEQAAPLLPQRTHSRALARPRHPQKLVGAGQQRPLRIIEGVSGVLRPGRFTLVLAPPGSGKTTLLRALVRRRACCGGCGWRLWTGCRCFEAAKHRLLQLGSPGWPAANRTDAHPLCPCSPCSLRRAGGAPARAERPAGAGRHPVQWAPPGRVCARAQRRLHLPGGPALRRAHVRPGPGPPACCLLLGLLPAGLLLGLLVGLVGVVEWALQAARCWLAVAGGKAGACCPAAAPTLPLVPAPATPQRARNL